MINPFRYKGYYFDTETELYYLNSRYYDPEICRFISADDVSPLTLTPGEVTDLNLFSYCDNNPVVRADVGGDVWHYFIGAAVGAAIGATVTGIASYIEDGKVDWTAVGLSAISGAASGALAASSIGVVGIAIRNAAISMTENAAAQVIHNGGFNNFSVGDMLIDGTIGGIAGALGGAGKGSKHLSNLGKQTIKRTVNAVSHDGLKVGVKEAGKALAYYGKNTVKYYARFRSGIWGDIATSVASSIATSNYMKNQYHQLLLR